MFRYAAIFACIVQLMSGTAKADTSVLTRSYNNERTGANLTESTLAPERVAAGLKKLFSILVTDDPRIEAQPLYVPGLAMSDGKHHDVLFVTTMGNYLWAFDASNGAAIWPNPVSLGTAFIPKVMSGPNEHRSTEIDSWGINIRWGVLSTPVIDRGLGVIYIVNWIAENSGPVLYLHARRLTDGKAVRAPVPISASITAANGKRVSLRPDQKQRAALLLVETPVPGAASRKFLYIATTGADSPVDLHGWLLAYDAETFRLAGAWVSTPSSFGGGIWQGGQGPSADSDGNVYVMTSNGGFLKDAFGKLQSFVGTTDFAESFVKVRLVFQQDGVSSLEMVDWFTPFLDSVRTSEGDYNYQDQDLGSAGPIVTPGTDFIIGAGKDGVLYVLDRSNFGRAVADFSKLKAPPAFFTFDAPSGTSADGPLDFPLPAKTHHLHGSPVYWNSPGYGPLLYVWGENESLRVWRLDPQSGRISLFGRSSEIASAALAKATGRGGMPGGMLTLSANGDRPHSGVVWATAPTDGDANREVAEGIIRAYDATELESTPHADGSGRLRLLWDSSRVPEVKFDFNKFTPPIVADGRLFVPTYSGRIDVYGPK